MPAARRRGALAAGPLERGAAAMLAAFPGSRATDRPTAESEGSCERRLWAAHGKRGHAVLVNEPS